MSGTPTGHQALSLVCDAPHSSVVLPHRLLVFVPNNKAPSSSTSDSLFPPSASSQTPLETLHTLRTMNNQPDGKESRRPCGFHGSIRGSVRRTAPWYHTSLFSTRTVDGCPGLKPESGLGTMNGVRLQSSYEVSRVVSGTRGARSRLLFGDLSWPEKRTMTSTCRSELKEDGGWTVGLFFERRKKWDRE